MCAYDIAGFQTDADKQASTDYLEWRGARRHQVAASGRGDAMRSMLTTAATAANTVAT